MQMLRIFLIGISMLLFYNEISTILFSFLAICAKIYRRNILSFQKVFKN